MFCSSAVLKFDIILISSSLWVRAREELINQFRGFVVFVVVVVAAAAAAAVVVVVVVVAPPLFCKGRIKKMFSFSLLKESN